MTSYTPEKPRRDQDSRNFLINFQSSFLPMPMACNNSSSEMPFAEHSLLPSALKTMLSAEHIMVSREIGLLHVIT